jgi:hypothetical protein
MAIKINMPPVADITCVLQIATPPTRRCKFMAPHFGRKNANPTAKARQVNWKLLKLATEKKGTYKVQQMREYESEQNRNKAKNNDRWR